MANHLKYFFFWISMILIVPQLTKVWCVDAELRRLHAALFAERKPSPALRNTPTRGNAGLSGNMIYHRCVLRLKLWYIKQSNYMSFQIYHIRYRPGYSPACSRHHQHYGCSRHCWTPGNSRFAPSTRTFHKWRNGLAPAGPYLGCPRFCSHHHYPSVHPDGNSGPRLITNEHPPCPSPHWGMWVPRHPRWAHHVIGPAPTLLLFHNCNVLGPYERYVIYLNDMFYTGSHFCLLPLQGPHASVPDAALKLNPHITDSQVQWTILSRQRPRVLQACGLTIQQGLIYAHVRRVQSFPKSWVSSLTFHVVSSRITRAFVIKTNTPTTSLKENGHWKGCGTMTLGLVQRAYSVRGLTCSIYGCSANLSWPLWSAVQCISPPWALHIQCRSIITSINGRSSGRGI